MYPPLMPPEQHQIDFANARAEAESLGYKFADDYAFDEWLAQLSENRVRIHEVTRPPSRRDNAG